MVKKRTRRWLALVAIITLASPLSLMMKVVITAPIITLFLLIFDEVEYRKEFYNEKSCMDNR